MVTEPMPCFYCGVPADSVDHVIPQSLLLAVAALDPRIARYLVRARSRVVPACRECNSALGSEVYRTMEDRRNAAKKHLRRKYRRALALPSWTAAEIRSLGFTLRTYVESGLRLQQLTEERLRWREPVKYVVASSRRRGSGKSTATVGVPARRT